MIFIVPFDSIALFWLFHMMSDQTLIPMRTVAVRRDVSTSAGQLELSERTPQNSSHTPLICSDVNPWVFQYRNSGNILIHINPRMFFFCSACGLPVSDTH